MSGEADRLFEAGMALIEASVKESAAYLAGADVRIAKLKAAQALEEAGKPAEARRLLREVEREQRKLGIAKEARSEQE